MWFATYVTGLAGSLMGWVYYSISARRRGIHPLESKMILGKMNVMLGLLLLFLGANQFTFDNLDATRIIVACLFLGVGGINLILGLRNYLRFKREWLSATRNKKSA
ncbi:YtpI family protein [Brevibacillus ginsengisoli]|uniref:YtpI family protein n=1 Tax=Brevibacillus ginsengisoli TaxID=363854 RepID=UPI003CE996F8